MNPREAQLWQKKFEQHLIATYGPIVKAAGIDIAQLIGTACYGLATAIMGAVKSRAPYVVKGTFGSHDYLGALKRMSPRELQEIRERISK
jgi:hypothetical protein